MARHLQLALVFVGMWVVGSDDDDGVIEERYCTMRIDGISLVCVW